MEKLNSFIKSFQETTNSFEKVVCIHDYFDYVKTDDKLNELLKNIIKRSEKNAKKIFELKKIENLTLKELGYKNGKCDIEDFFWIIFSLYMLIYKKMKLYKTANKIERKKIEKFMAQEITRPDLLKLTETFFFLIHQYIITLLNRENFINNDSGKIIFDEKQSILYFYGKPIKISKYKNKTVGHYVLKYIFIKNKNTINNNFPFSEIHDDEYKDEEYKQTKYTTACNDINEKIRIGSPTKINDFLEFGKGKKSEVWINSKYLKDIK
ncbi:hypothetical protein KAI65_06470 [Candidatus Parcubacteria bacterium]|nr:hypothetical protein [Candidatus Parcubacteria bacterium]